MDGYRSLPRLRKTILLRQASLFVIVPREISANISLLLFTGGVQPGPDPRLGSRICGRRPFNADVNSFLHGESLHSDSKSPGFVSGNLQICRHYGKENEALQRIILVEMKTSVPRGMRFRSRRQDRNLQDERVHAVHIKLNSLGSIFVAAVPVERQTNERNVVSV